ncbi:MAG: hypothetical protein COV99_01965 [Bacteroidetes bacterium CG12_big_fil_rev_8_21_14_0_65_60_17]|nr:MAG: hypothetical protein COV99_01965 [Bacteroidetes bacterium CG12_big_fil_rev_8_21_14_0_65_60_17]
MSIELSKENREEAIQSLQAYMRDEHDEEVGSIAAGSLLDHVLADIGPCIHNEAIRMVQERLVARIAELDVDIGEPEFPLSRRHY